jgi:hypothetical protein
MSKVFQAELPPGVSFDPTPDPFASPVEVLRGGANPVTLVIYLPPDTEWSIMATLPEGCRVNDDARCAVLLVACNKGQMTPGR